MLGRNIITETTKIKSKTWMDDSDGIHKKTFIIPLIKFDIVYNDKYGRNGPKANDNSHTLNIFTYNEDIKVTFDNTYDKPSDAKKKKGVDDNESSVSINISLIDENALKKFLHAFEHLRVLLYAPNSH